MAEGAANTSQIWRKNINSERGTQQLPAAVNPIEVAVARKWMHKDDDTFFKQMKSEKQQNLMMAIHLSPSTLVMCERSTAPDMRGRQVVERKCNGQNAEDASACKCTRHGAHSSTGGGRGVWRERRKRKGKAKERKKVEDCSKRQ